MKILTYEEYEKQYGDDAIKELNNRDDKQLGWLESDYIEYKYSEYIDKIKEELCDKIYKIDNISTLIKIGDII